MRAAKTAFRVLLSLAVSAIFIAFSLRHTDPRSVAAAIASADPWPAFAYLGLLLLIHLVRTVRWGLLLEPVGHVGFKRLNSASAIGFMMLVTLPLRLGELARPLLISRPPTGAGPRLARSGALASCVVERIVDSLGVGVLGIVALHVLATRGSSADFARRASNLVTAGFGALCLALAIAFFMRERAVALVRRVLAPIAPGIAERAAWMLDNFIRGLHLGSAARVLAVLALTAAHWGLHVLGFYWLAPAFGMQLSPLMAGTVLASQVVGVMIPAGPGMLGTSQFFTQAGLSIFVPGALTVPEVAARAAAYANTIWMLQFGQQVVLGLIYLAIDRVPLSELFAPPGAGEPTPAPVAPAASSPAADPPDQAAPPEAVPAEQAAEVALSAAGARARSGGGARAACNVIVVIALGIFAVRALHTGMLYNHTFDEPTQIASGIELLQYGTFTLHMDVPPLAKLLIAAPVYLEGIRLARAPSRVHEEASDMPVPDANDLLYRGDHYWATLRTARAVVCAVGVVLLASIYIVASRRFGAGAGAVAAVAASVSPGLVSAASIANSDMVGVLTLLLALLAWHELLMHGGLARAALFAIALSAALLAKLSALPFLIFSLPVMTLWLRSTELLGAIRAPLRWLRAQAGALAVIVVLVPLCLAAAYGFHRAPIVGKAQAERVGATLEARSHLAAQLARSLASVALPGGEFVRGMARASIIAREGHPAYLMGRRSLHGWPQYFLITLGLKVPIGILAAVVVGLALALRRRRTQLGRDVLLLGLIAAAILASVARAGVNAGHRHIVVIEALLALIAAGGFALARSESGRLRAPLVALLLACVGAGAVASIRAHPDALGYTNAFAGPQPDWWFVDSNMDWGQDLERLRRWLDERRVREPIHLAYFGSADPVRHGLHFHELMPGERATGWVAVSVHYQRGMYGAGIGHLGSESQQNGYAWLLPLRPEAQIGTSIRVYHLQSTQQSPLSAVN